MRDKVVAALARLARLAAEHDDTGDGRPVAQRRGAGDHPRQAVRYRRRRAAGRPTQRLDDLIARYPLRGIKGPVGTSQDMLDLLGGDASKLAELESEIAAHLGFEQVLDSVGQVYPRSLDYDVRVALVQLVGRPVSLATTIRLMRQLALRAGEMPKQGLVSGQLAWDEPLGQFISPDATDHCDGLQTSNRYDKTQSTFWA